MSYIRINLLCCILLTSFLWSVHSQPGLSLRQKLERLLQDAEYDEANNEIQKPQQTQGMILKDLRERGIFDTSSEERFLGRLKTLKGTHLEEKLSPVSAATMATTLTTTTSTPDKVGFAVDKTTTSGLKPSSVIGSIGSLRSLILRFIDMWRK